MTKSSIVTPRTVRASRESRRSQPPQPSIIWPAEAFWRRRVLCRTGPAEDLTDEFEHCAEQRKQKVRELERALLKFQRAATWSNSTSASAEFPRSKNAAKSDALCIRIEDAADVATVSPRKPFGFGHSDHTSSYTWTPSGDHI